MAQVVSLRGVAHIPPYQPPERRSGPPDGVIAQVDRIWRETAASTGGMPDRSGIDAIELGVDVLPWVILAAVEDISPELILRYRLCGTGIAGLMGRDVTGASSTEAIKPDNRGVILRPYTVTLQERAPSFWETSMLHERTGWRPVYRGVWPYTDGGDDIAIMLNITIPVTLGRVRRTL